MSLEEKKPVRKSKYVIKTLYGPPKQTSLKVLVYLLWRK